MADSVKIKITGDDSQFTSTLNGIEKKARGAISSVGSVFKGVMASQIVTRGLSLLSNAFTGTMATGMEFGEAMSKVAATSGATADEIDRLTEKAKQMGATTQFTASEAAEAMNYMAMAGWKTEQMMGGIEGIMHLAAASGEDLATTSDIVTDALTAFGMSADQAGHFADILAAASSNANTNVAMMGETFKYAAPLAGALGYDAEDVAVAIGLMANSGIKASQAGTALQGWLTRLSKPTKESNEAMRALGISLTNADGSMKPFMQVLEETREAFSGLTEKQKAQYAAALAGQRGMSGLLAIVNASESDFEQLTGAITNCSGAAENMAEIRMDNLAGDVKILRSALEGLQITASESMDGTARTLVQEATGIVDAMNKAGKRGGIGGMFSSLLDQIPKLLPKLYDRVGKLIQNIGKRIPRLVKGITKTIPALLDGIVELAPKLADVLFDTVGEATSQLIIMLPKLVPKILEGVYKLAGSILKGIKDSAIKIGKALLGIEDKEYESIGTITGEVTYIADSNAEIDLSGAEAAATEKWTEFRKSLETDYGLTTEQVAKIMAFKGTPEQLEAYLIEHFPNLDAAARAAIMANFTPIQGGKSLKDIFAETEKVGLTAEDVVGIMLGTDCTKEGIDDYLLANFPNLNEAARTAVENALVGEDGTSLADSLISDLSYLGLSNDDIAAIILAKATGDEATIESILSTKYAGVYQEARAAIDTAWNTGRSAYQTQDTGLSYGTQLLVDMFTNGKKDDPAAVQAALRPLREQIAAKKRELEAYIAGGGEDVEGAQAAIAFLDQYDAALVDYATNYANASTEICKEQGESLLAMCQQAEDATNEILAKRDQLITHQGNMYTKGSMGIKLSKEDYTSALDYITVTYEDEVVAITKARDAAVEAATTQEEYNAAQQQYLDAMEAAAAERDARISALISGQTRADNPANAALIDLAGFLKTNFNTEGADVLTENDVVLFLKSLGYDEDTINAAIDQVFGEGLVNEKTILKAEEEGLFGALDNATIEALMWAARDGNLTREKFREIIASFNEEHGDFDGFLGDFATNFIEESLFGNRTIDYSGLVDKIDLSGAGGAVKTAIEGKLLPEFEEVDDDDLTGAIDDWIMGHIGNIDVGKAAADTREKTAQIGKFGVEGLESGLDDTSSIEKKSRKLGESVIDPMKNVLMEASPSKATQEIGEYAVEGFVNGMDDTSGVEAASAALGTAAVTSMRNNAKGTESAGLQIAAGMARGILSGRSLVVNAALEMALAAAQAIRDALGIRSPSRVGISLGANFGDAFGSGLQDSLHSALRSAQTVIGLENLSPKMDFGGLTGPFGRMLQDFANVETGRHIDLYVNGRKMASTMENDTAVASAAYSRRVALGYGK